MYRRGTIVLNSLNCFSLTARRTFPFRTIRLRFRYTTDDPVFKRFGNFLSWINSIDFLPFIYVVLISDPIRSHTKKS